MLGVGFSEILIIALVSFIALGPKQIPGIMRKLAFLYKQLMGLREDFRMQILSLEDSEKPASPQNTNTNTNTSAANINMLEESKHG